MVSPIDIIQRSCTKCFILSLHLQQPPFYLSTMEANLGVKIILCIQPEKEWRVACAMCIGCAVTGISIFPMSDKLTHIAFDTVQFAYFHFCVFRSLPVYPQMFPCGFRGKQNGGVHNLLFLQKLWNSSPYISCNAQWQILKLDGRDENHPIKIVTQKWTILSRSHLELHYKSNFTLLIKGAYRLENNDCVSFVFMVLFWNQRHLPHNIHLVMN